MKRQKKTTNRVKITSVEPSATAGKLGLDLRLQEQLTKALQEDTATVKQRGELIVALLKAQGTFEAWAALTRVNRLEKGKQLARIEQILQGGKSDALA